MHQHHRRVGDAGLPRDDAGLARAPSGDRPLSPASPPDGVLAAERAELLRRAVAALSENQRRALLLHRFEGLSYREVAEAMGLTLEAVRSLLVRARRNLHDRLAPLLRADEPAAEGEEP